MRARGMRTNGTRRIRTLVARIQPDARQCRTETDHMLSAGATRDRRGSARLGSRLGSARLDFDSSRPISIRFSAARFASMPQIKKDNKRVPFFLFSPPFFATRRDGFRFVKIERGSTRFFVDTVGKYSNKWDKHKIKKRKIVAL